jgi:DNA-binding NtrC family response regulator
MRARLLAPLRIPAGSLNALARHHWPGNIRELENVLQQAIILSRDGVLDLSGFAGEGIEAIDAPRLEATQVRSMIDAERGHLRFVLEHARWRIEGLAGAAELLGAAPEHTQIQDAETGYRASWQRGHGIARPLTSGPGPVRPAIPQRCVWGPPSQQAC